MITVIQRTDNASVEINGKRKGDIGAGMVVLLGVCNGDTEADADYLAGKIAGLRFFEDDEGKMNRSVQEVCGSALVISQFTLCADCRKGRRPSFNDAAPPDTGERLYEYFKKQLNENGVPVAPGEFGAMMDVHLVNKGPVTFILDSKKGI